MESSVVAVVDVLRSVGFSAAYWRELGQRLKPDIDFDAISANCSHRAQDRLEAVVSSWLRDGALQGSDEGGGAWEVLASAVERCRRGGGRNVAAMIRQKVESLGSPAIGIASSEVTSTPLLTAKPTLNQLHSFKINDVVISVIRTVAPHWEILACTLGVPETSVAIIRRDHSGDSVRGCERMLREWLEGREGVRRPLTWGTLAAALTESGEFQVLANRILTNINNLEQ